MRWEDESYVKLYVRDTLTWLSWSWQARTVFMHLLRKVDLAGILNCDGFSPVEAVAVLTGLPVEVVGPGMADLSRTGTIDIRADCVVMPKFVEAQEARKTERLRKKDQRQRDRDKARGDGFVGSDFGADQLADLERSPPTAPNYSTVTRGHAESHGVTPVVTRSHTASHEVTRGHPSSSSSSPTSSPSSESAPVASQPPLVLESPEPRKPKKPTDPRRKPLQDAICADYIEATGNAYRWQGAKDGDALTFLLSSETPEEIRARWRFSLSKPSPWLTCSTVAQLRSKWNDLGTAMPQVRADPCLTAGCEYAAKFDGLCETHHIQANAPRGAA